MSRRIFVAALPRSGSTILGALLQQHPLIYHAGESFYWHMLDPKVVQCSCGRTGCEFLLKIKEMILDSKHSREILGIGHACGLIDRYEEPLKEAHAMSLSYGIPNARESQVLDALPSCIMGFNELAKIYQQASHRPILVDNSKYIRIAEMLVEYDWQIILVTRDPRGLACSNEKLCKRKGIVRPLAQKLPAYRSFARRACRLAQSPGVLHVRYEDLCSATEGVLQGICEFLGTALLFQLHTIVDRSHVLAGNRVLFSGGTLALKPDEEWRTVLAQDDLDLIMNDSGLMRAYEELGYNLGT